MKEQLQYNPASGLLLSFYNREFYSEVLNKWTGYGFKFLGLAVFAQCVIHSLVMFLIIAQLQSSIINPLIANTPDFKIANGECQFERSYVSDYKIEDHPLFYFCNEDISYDKNKAALFQINHNRFFVLSQTQPNGFTESNFKSVTNFDKNLLKTYVGFVSVIPWLSIILYPLIYIISLIGCFITGGFLAIITNIAKTQLSYEQVVRALIISSIPNRLFVDPILVYLLFISHNNYNILSFFVWLIYFIMIIKSRNN